MSFDSPKTKAMRAFLQREAARVVGLSIEGDGVFIYTESARWCDDSGAGTFRGDSETAAIRRFYECVRPAAEVPGAPERDPMTNRDRLRAMIKSLAGRALMEELQARLWVDRELPEPGELPFDICDAFLDLDDLAESDPGWQNFQRGCRTILIHAGFYRPISEEEISRTVCTGRSRAWAFQDAGIKYTADQPIVSWLAA